jgi:hypothetical protein
MSMFRAIVLSSAMIGLTTVAIAQSGTPEEQGAPAGRMSDGSVTK